MTDNNIIKGYECCVLNAANCTGGCPYRGTSGLYSWEPQCFQKLRNDTLDLINRQKAEIERLRKAFIGECVLSSCSLKAELKSEAIKEFAERLKKQKYYGEDLSGMYGTYVVEVETIDNLVKEMTEENK